MASDEFLAWCDDLHQVKGNISQLQATLNHVLAKAPTVGQYKQLMAQYSQNGLPNGPSGLGDSQTGHLGDRLRLSLLSPQIKVAVRLKYLYDRGSLPFLMALTRINFKSGKSDRYVGEFLDYQPVTKEVKTADMKHEPVGKHNGTDESAHPPSLPPLSDPLLLKLVLTDKSLRQPSDFLELETADGHHDYNNNHNRKLAIRGAKLLDLALVDILDEHFPSAHEDDVEYLKYRLTSNHILARLAYCYNLSEAVMHNVSTELPAFDKLVIFKNAFLAYIGAMSKDNYSYPDIRSWIDKLFEPFVLRLQKDSSQSEKLKSPQSIAMSEFHFLIDRVNGFLDNPKKKIAHEFKFEQGRDPLACQLIVDTLHLGSGIGATHNDAKKNAVYATFEDRELRTSFLGHLATHYSVPATIPPREQSQPDAGQPPQLVQPPGEPHSSVTEVEIPQTASGGDDDDDAYSPGLEGEDDYDPANIGSPTQTTEVPTKTSLPAPPAPVPTPTPTAPQSAGPSHQPRMPLPYGALPAIPNAKKRGAAQRR